MKKNESATEVKTRGRLRGVTVVAGNEQLKKKNGLKCSYYHTLLVS